MRISELLTPAGLACDLKVRGKKGALDTLASLLAAEVPGLSRAEILEGLTARERLGSTGLGLGVAIPHGRLHGIDRAHGAFLRIKGCVDFDAIDNQPVDLLFALIVPSESTDEHLMILAQLAEMFSEVDFIAHLRASTNPGETYQLLAAWEPRR
jgi:PTS system nitrogen regulatory IIA component